MDLSEKRKKLAETIEANSPLAVALSGGSDSSFLLAFAKQVIGERVIALTSVSRLHGKKARADAVRVASEAGVRIIEVETGRLDDSRFIENRPDRCYTCKSIMFDELWAAARKNGARCLADGVCADDLQEYRPGLAAARERGVISPLALAGLSKSEIRILAREIGLFTWNKPPGACLATRIPYGTPITDEALAMIEEAEEAVLCEGFTMCRVRHHGRMAKIEVPADELHRLSDRAVRERIVDAFAKIGFSIVCADLAGYRSGTMDILAGTKD